MYKILKCKTNLPLKFTINVNPDAHTTEKGIINLFPNYSLVCNPRIINSKIKCDIQDLSPNIIVSLNSEFNINSVHTDGQIIKLTSNFELSTVSKLYNGPSIDNPSVIRLKLEQIPELNYGQQYKVVIDRSSMIEEENNHSILADDGSYNGTSLMFTVYNINGPVIHHINSYNQSALIARVKIGNKIYNSQFIQNSIGTRNRFSSGIFNSIFTDTTIGNKISFEVQGDNRKGQLIKGLLGSGNDTRAFNLFPWQTGNFFKCNSIGAGTFFSIISKDDGTIWGCGQNQYYELGLGSNTTTTYTSLQQIGTDTDWSSVYTSSVGSFTIAKKNNGDLYSFGKTFATTITTPTYFMNGSNFTKIVPVANSTFSLYLKNTGEIYKTTDVTNGITLQQIGTDTDWVDIFGGSKFAAAIKSNGSLYLWGSGDSPSSYFLPATNPTLFTYSGPWSKVSQGSYQFIILAKSNGDLYSWGYNDKGQTGQGSAYSSTYNNYTYIGNFGIVDSITCQEKYVILKTTTGDIYHWGTPGYLSSGTTIWTPTLLKNVPPSTKVFCGLYFNYLYRD